MYKLYWGHIGWWTYIGPPLHLVGARRIAVGARVRIFPGARMEVHGSNSSITIEDNVGIAQSFHITSGGHLVIGKNSTIAAHVSITNIDHTYQIIGKSILDQPFVINETRIGENCFIGMGARIQPGTVLGKQCVVGANSVVRGKFPDYSVIVGAPARIVKKYNSSSGHWEKTDKDGNFI